MGKTCEPWKGGTRSVPHAAFVKRHLVLFQKRPQLILKRPHLMMLSLIANVFVHFGRERLAHRERRIPILPMNSAYRGPIVFNHADVLVFVFSMSCAMVIVRASEQRMWI